ncbi:hypothetical protein TrST_g12872 [Triparma strigata]|uniref:EF-hand domain-containing protein n=1 Tax=Triparma strigata TaxID=1606541 RepID=A0A9W7E551_9STRA|nr:hypothetical protein TrST_g12872 [Triparma strigata]
MGGGASKGETPEPLPQVPQAPPATFDFAQGGQQGLVQPNPNAPPVKVQVVVPGGFPPGSTFPAQYGGTMFNVTVPPNTLKGAVMNVTVPFQQAQPTYMQVGGQMVDINLVISQFTNIDANGDGKLSLDEFRRGQQNVLGQMYNDQMCCMMFQSLDSNQDGGLDLREYLIGNGVERQAAKAVMDSWRAQRKAVKEQIASERARQKAEREQAKAERELERERARNDRLEYGRGGGFGGGGFGRNNYRTGGGGNVGGGGGGGEVGEYGEEVEEGGEGEEGEEGEEVGMYGAAPQDLPDGGPSFGGDAPKVLAGGFAKRKKADMVVKKIPAKKLQREILDAFKQRFRNSLQFPTPDARVVSLASLQSKKARDPEDITIVTQCSIDRAERLKAMCKSWDGAISCAVHVPAGRDGGFESILKTLLGLHKYVEQECACKLDLQLRQEHVVGDGLYPINALRNVALDAARTERVLLLDVDFEVSAGGNESLKRSARGVRAGAGVALVVPAFELSYGHLGRAAALLSSPKSELEKCEGITGFHIGHFPRGHRATKFQTFFGASEDYEVEYEDCYEPYVVVEKATVPRYDERFRGYGLNKVSQIMALSLTHKFVVSHECFVVSPEMEKSESWKKMYGKVGGVKDPLLAVKVQVLFDHFRSETKVKGGRKKVKADEKKKEKKGGERRGLGKDLVFDFGEPIEAQVIGPKTTSWLAKALTVVVGAGIVAGWAWREQQEEGFGVGIY